MNKIQRILLLFFSFVILLSSSNECIKFFLTAIPLFLFFSPRTWFTSNEISHDDGLPVIGFPTPETTTVLLTLLQLRSAEIGSVYRTIRNYQETASDGEWVVLFIKDYISCPREWWDEYSDKKKLRLEKKAYEIFEKRYKYLNCSPYADTKNECMDLLIGIYFWDTGFGTIIKALEELKVLGILSEKIDALIKEYKFISKLTLHGSRLIAFRDVFVLKNVVYNSYLKIFKHWDDITRCLELITVFSSDSKDFFKGTDSNEIFKKIECLRELEKYIHCAMGKPNSKAPGCLPSERAEASFFNDLKRNVFWGKYF